MKHGNFFETKEQVVRMLKPGEAVVAYPFENGFMVYGDPEISGTSMGNHCLSCLMAGAKMLGYDASVFYGEGSKKIEPESSKKQKRFIAT